MAKDDKKKNATSKGAKATKKMTKDERKAKYTKIAHERSAKQWARSKDATKICFNCRKQGHAVANCPAAKQEQQQADAKICFKCGSTEHGLYKCPKLKHKDDQDLPFATCFVCKKVGHLARQCPTNEKGVFINGGACKHCGSTRHFATECPDKKQKVTEKQDDGVCVDDLLEDAPPKPKQDDQEKKKKQQRIVNF